MNIMSNFKQGENSHGARKIILETARIMLMAMIFSVGLGVAFVWAGSTATAPNNGSVTAPINVSSASQIKLGGLWVNSLGIDNGLIVANGNVGIGMTSPTAKLDVAGSVKVANDTDTCNSTKAGTIRWTGKVFEGCTGGPEWTSLSSVNNGETPSTATVPVAPTNAIATTGNAQASVAFSPMSDGGSAIISYRVTSHPKNNLDNFGPSTAGSASPITVTGLTNGTAYIFTVTATNAIGVSSPSGPSNTVTPYNPVTTVVIANSGLNKTCTQLCSASSLTCLNAGNDVGASNKMSSYSCIPSTSCSFNDQTLGSNPCLAPSYYCASNCGYGSSIGVMTNFNCLCTK